MKPFDFNIHPNFSFTASQDVLSSVNNELNCDDNLLLESIKYSIIHENWSQYLCGFNLMVFTNFFHKHPQQTTIFTNNLTEFAASNSLKVSYTFLVNPLIGLECENILRHWVDAGVRYIKFHSYHQQIDESKFDSCVKISKIAQSLGLGICIDASYGTKGLFKYDNLRLAACILEHVDSVPVVILHAGGLRAYEASLLANDCANVRIEMSFSPHFYRNTAIFSSFKDIFHLVSPSQIIYASDYPYITLEESLEVFNTLVKGLNLTEQAMNSFLYRNALLLIS